MSLKWLIVPALFLLAACGPDVASGSDDGNRDLKHFKLQMNSRSIEKVLGSSKFKVVFRNDDGNYLALLDYTGTSVTKTVLAEGWNPGWGEGEQVTYLRSYPDFDMEEVCRYGASKGVRFIGHTEIFAELTKTNDPLTMFETNGMRVFFLTRHVSLRDMLDMITKERIIDYVERCTEALARLGVKEGTMAVAGLNPHSGEHGLFGWEEVNEIAPAVEELKARGFNVVGPVPADSVFHQAALGRFNSVLSLYHDQGHIATKTLDFDRTIAITNSMPILRTSVDHGTAFDIAGKGIAGAVSMIESVRLAAKYAPYFTR